MARGRRKERKKKKKKSEYLLLHLLPYLHSRIFVLQIVLLCPLDVFPCFRTQLWNGDKIKVGIQMPKHGRGNSNQRTMGKLGLSFLDGLERRVVYHNLVEAGLDQAACEMLQLFSRLYQQVVSTGRHAHGDALSRVSGPDVQARVARAAMDGQEVEICVKAGQDSVLLTVFGEVGGGRG
jgi:hypothetical protein